MQTIIKKQLKNWALSCASLLALTCIAPANAQTLEFASVFPESDFSSLSVKHWTEGVTKATDGRIKFRIHWSGSLVGNKMVDAMRDGVVDAALSFTPYVSGLMFPSVFRSTLKALVPSIARSCLLSIRSTKKEARVPSRHHPRCYLTQSRAEIVS